jgi:hypothetical protein
MTRESFTQAIRACDSAARGLDGLPGVLKQAVKQIRTADSGEVGSSWFSSQPVSLKSTNSMPVHAVAQISSSDGVFDRDTLPNSENFAQESGSAVNVKLSRVECPLELAARPSDVTRAG